VAKTPDEVKSKLSREAREALDVLQRDLESASVAGLALFGSAVRGDWDARRSDVNVAVVLSDPDEQFLARTIGPALRQAFRTARVEPWILREAEASELADAFPVKMLDVSRRHCVLHGEDVLACGEIHAGHLRLRVEQQLRNRLHRLRRRAAIGGDDEGDLLRSLRVAARGLAFELEGLLQAAGEAATGDSRQEVYEAAVARFGLDGGTTERLLAIREGEADARPHDLFGATLALMQVAVDAADALEGDAA
jgi:predicted nucleotidyltransferase